MCLISVLKKGTVKYNETVEAFIRRGMESQRDGSGIMWKREGENVVNIKKGIFDVENLLGIIKDLKLKEADELVIHHRTGTQGLISQSNCHPFVISPDHNTCIALEGSFKLPVLAHNGIFNHLHKYDHEDFSDTYSFAHGFMNRPYGHQFFEDDQELFLTIFSKIVSWSRLAIMYPNKDLVMTGTFYEDEGYYHSSMCYKTYGMRDIGGRTYMGGDYNHSQEIVYTNTSKKGRAGLKETSDGHYTCNLTPHSSLVKEQLASFTRNIPLDKLPSLGVKVIGNNAHHFVYVLKKDESHPNIETVVAYRLTNWNSETGVVNLYMSSNKNMLWTVGIEDLRNKFNFSPISEYMPIYQDFIFMEERLNPSKSQFKKLEKQVLSKYNQHEKTRFIVKSLGVPMSKAGVETWLTKHRDDFTKKKQSGHKTYVLNAEGKLVEKVKKEKTQEDREMSFSD